MNTEARRSESCGYEPRPRRLGSAPKCCGGALAVAPRTEQTRSSHGPGELVPLAAVAAGLIDFGIAFIVLIGLLKFYGYAITALVWTLPLFMLLAMTTALAVSLWLSALNVQYRDTGLLMPLLTQVWFFSTPIIYPSSLVPEHWRPLYDVLNPMTIVVEGFRWALVGTEVPNEMLWVPVLIVAGLLVGGLYYFRRTERIFADVV